MSSPVSYNTTEEGAVQVAEAMREQIETCLYLVKEKTKVFCQSWGGAVIPKEGMVPVDLVAMGSHLYKAK